MDKSTQINNVQEAYAKRKEMWTAMDVNGNGYLSLAEVTKVPTNCDLKVKVSFIVSVLPA